ncbi:hypothetical protein IPJ72_00155 [Candidatus Peregrinibacteria bacterium]|nr:MAG: hypothetical protein IPJ72_00155 [Candidatus Peregrinibacteria bacterium]
MKAKQPIIYVLIMSVVIISCFFVNHKVKQNKLCPDELAVNRTPGFVPKEIGGGRQYLKNGQKIDTSNWDLETARWVEKNCKYKTTVVE